MSITVDFGDHAERTDSDERLRELVAEGVAKFGELHIQWPVCAVAALCGRPILVETMFTVALDVFEGEARIFEGTPVCSTCVARVPK